MIPRSTYRLQFHEGFTLRQALEIVPYLHELGISHIYASPLFKARPHSTHGYDTCDFSQLNPELGTEADLEKLARELHVRGMGLVLDIAPNHMGIGGPENRWWWDVLARGPSSPFAKYFDIDWNPTDPRLHGKVLVPVLGDRYHRALARRELQIENRRGGCLLRYGENAFPINEQSLQTVRATAEELNADPEALDALIEQQFYRLAWYGRGDSELNYRRFCNIATLPGLRVDDFQVFDQVFALTAQWLQKGWLDGLRVDHLDGLADPEQFLFRLKKLAPDAWIVVEKILDHGESLPESWPIAGTTGYDFLNQVGGLFIDPAGEQPLTEAYFLSGGSAPGYASLARGKKRLVLMTLLAAEVEHLTDLLLRIAANHWHYCDFARTELAGAVIECVTCFPTYRSYVRPDHGPVSDSDARHILEATTEARRGRPDMLPDLFEFLKELLLLEQTGEAEGGFVTRFQQLCAAAAAKGIEDTAFYCFNRLVALNEVGGDPNHFVNSIDEFHQACIDRHNQWPNAMLATSTHDTKRSEDARARLCLLSEIPQRWSEAVARWSARNKRHRRHGWPGQNMEYLFYQTLVGAWPLPVPRALAYMQKAAHEAKEHTSYDPPNVEYDEALRDFVVNSMADLEFVGEIEQFVKPLVKPGCINSLAQTLLKLTVPGVPDTYQGTELWDLSLVDPDNRRPVDFKTRRRLLSQASALSAEEAWSRWESGMSKLWLIRRVLELRARRPEWFYAAASYEALAATGEASAHVVAFKRGDDMIAVAPRLVIGLKDNWRGTTLNLPQGRWRNELTGEDVSQGVALLSDLLARFPIAVLIRKEVS